MKEVNVIKKGKVITPFKTIEKGVVVFEGKKIIAVGRENEVKTPKRAKIIDASDRIVAPGFIDIHVHGGKGKDVMDASYEAINELSKFFATHGTTAFVATTISASHDELLNVARAVRLAMEKGTDGAEVLGIHMEGPYMSPDERGAHAADQVRAPSLEEFKEIWEASNGAVRMVTLAPEWAESEKFIENLRSLGVVASVGHSNATYSQVVDAIQHGLKHATHTFHRMKVFHHREPGVVGAVLVHDELTAELICDNVHVHPTAMKLLIKAKGANKVALITDAIRAAGMLNGEYKVGKATVIVKNGISRSEAGELAGSTLTMDRAVGNMVKSVGLSLQTAIRMATTNPATTIGIDKMKGSLKTGKDADIVIIDEEVNVYMTIVKGRVVYAT